MSFILILRRFIACALPFGGLVFALADFLPAGVQDTIPMFWAALSISLFPPLWERNPDPFSPTSFFAVVSLQLWSIIIGQWSEGRVELTGLPSMSYLERVETMNRVSVALGLSFVAYFAGYFSLGRNLKGKIFTSFPERWSPIRMRLVMFGLLVVFLICYGYFQSRVGVGIGTLSQNEGRALMRNDPTLSWVQRGVYLGIIPVALLAESVLKKPVRWDRAVLVALGAAVYAYLILRLGPRGPVITIVGILVVCFHYRVKRIPIPLFVLGVLTTVIFLTFLNDLRSAQEGDDVTLLETERFEAREIASKHEQDRTRLPAMATVMYFFPERTDFLLGESFAAIAIAPIPRWVLPEKKTLLNADTGIVYNLIGTPAPSSFPFVAYANFGWLGLIIGQLLYGAFHRALHNWFLVEKGKPGVIGFYMLLLLQFTPTSLGVAAALGSVLPIWVFARFMGAPKRTTSAPRLGSKMLSPIPRT